MGDDWRELENGEDVGENFVREIQDRVMALRVNAMGPRDAATLLLRLQGDLDFSAAPVVMNFFDEALPSLAEALAHDPPETPGGYLVSVVRRAYLNAQGNAVDSDVVVLAVGEREACFDRPDRTTRAPGFDAWRQAERLGEALDQRLSEAPTRPRPRI